MTEFSSGTHRQRTRAQTATPTRSCTFRSYQFSYNNSIWFIHTKFLSPSFFSFLYIFFLQSVNPGVDSVKVTVEGSISPLTRRMLLDETRIQFYYFASSFISFELMLFHYLFYRKIIVIGFQIWPKKLSNKCWLSHPGPQPLLHYQT